MDPAAAPAPPRTFLPAAAAALAHLALDAVQSLWGPLRPPYLRFDEMPEAFRELPFVSAPVAVSVAAAAVGGILAAISLAAVEPGAPNRLRLITVLVTGLWLFSAFLSWATWLSSPLTAVLPGILAGFPRGLTVGWLVWRLSRPAGASRPA